MLHHEEAMPRMLLRGTYYIPGPPEQTKNVHGLGHYED
jgi:hypothetical protein